jgi:hypothetical protein
MASSSAWSSSPRRENSIFVFSETSRPSHPSSIFQRCVVSVCLGVLTRRISMPALASVSRQTSRRAAIDAVLERAQGDA